MTTIKSPIPNRPNRADACKMHWTCFFVTVAALQLTACGGGGDTASNAVSGAARSSIVVEKKVLGAKSCASQINDTSEKLLGCVALPAVRAHQTALAEIAKANDGTRMAGTSGYDASVAYARKVFEDAGYQVTVQPFEFPLFSAVDSSLTETGLATPILNRVLNYSGSGDVTAQVSW